MIAPRGEGGSGRCTEWARGWPFLPHKKVATRDPDTLDLSLFSQRSMLCSLPHRRRGCAPTTRRQQQSTRAFKCGGLSSERANELFFVCRVLRWWESWADVGWFLFKKRIFVWNMSNCFLVKQQNFPETCLFTASVVFQLFYTVFLHNVEI